MLAAFRLNVDAVALTVGSLEIRWYGIFVALGFLAGMIVLQVFARRRGMRSEDGGDLALPALIGGILGARIFYVIQFWPEFRGDFASAFAIHKGGLVFYGGLIGATVAVIGFCRWRKLGIAAVGDLFGLALPLGQAIGRLGCLFNACCFGVPAKGFWSLLYPPSRESVLHIQQIKHVVPPWADACHPVLPVQLHMTFTNLAVFAILIVLSKRITTPGRLGALSLMLYAVGRFANEYFRGDHLTYVGPFTVSQTVSLALFPLGLACWYAAGKFAANKTPSPSTQDVDAVTS